MAKAPFKAIIAALLCCWPALLWAAEPEDELRAAYACFRLDDLACARSAWIGSWRCRGSPPPEKTSPAHARRYFQRTPPVRRGPWPISPRPSPSCPPVTPGPGGVRPPPGAGPLSEGGRYRLAEADYDLALAQNPQDAGPISCAAICGRLSGATPRALADYGRSLEINPPTGPITSAAGCWRAWAAGRRRSGTWRRRWPSLRGGTATS